MDNNKLTRFFNELVNTLQKYDCYQEGDEVDIDLQNLKEGIKEVSQRLSVIESIAKNVSKSIRIYEDAVDCHNPFTMDVNHYDTILNLTNDIDALTDLNNDEPIKENWHGAFIKEEESIDDKLTKFYIDLSKRYLDFHYDDMVGGCYIKNDDKLYSYDCTPFWEDAKGIAINLNKDDEPISSYVINCDEPTTVEELQDFMNFYELQVSLMIKAIQ